MGITFINHCCYKIPKLQQLCAQKWRHSHTVDYAHTILVGGQLMSIPQLYKNVLTWPRVGNGS